MNKRVKVFSADFCGPCKLLKAVVLPKLESSGWVVEVVDIETPEGEEEFRAEGYRGIPTSQVYKDDVLVKTFNGSVKLSQFEEVME